MFIALIPAYGEEKSIGNVIKETLKYVDKVVVIDDGSKDRTVKIANDLGATVLRHSKNMGVGAAMRTGIDYAKKVKPDLLVALDADGQHNPNDIPRLIKPILSGEADFVIGSRMLENDKQMPFIKLVGNKILNLIVSIFIKRMISDSQSGFRALNQESIMALNLEGDKTYVQEMIIELSLKGKKIKEVPIETNHRNHGKSKVTSNTIEYIIKTMPIILRTYIRCLRARDIT